MSEARSQQTTSRLEFRVDAVGREAWFMAAEQSKKELAALEEP